MSQSPKTAETSLHPGWPSSRPSSSPASGKQTTGSSKIPLISSMRHPDRETPVLEEGCDPAIPAHFATNPYCLPDMDDEVIEKFYEIEGEIEDLLGDNLTEFICHPAQVKSASGVGWAHFFLIGMPQHLLHEWKLVDEGLRPLFQKAFGPHFPIRYFDIEIVPRAGGTRT